MLLSFTACSGQQEQSQSETAPVETAAPETVPPTEPEPELHELYTINRQHLLDAANLTLDITDRVSYTVAQSEFGYSSIQTLQLANRNTDNVRVKLSEKVTGDGYEDTFDDIFISGTLYSKVYGEYLFCGSIEQDTYLSQFAPAAVLDSTLYQDITASAVADGTLLKFESPTGPETWAMPEGAEFYSASGSAFLNADGTIKHSTYTITYQEGPATITRTVKVVPTVESSLSINEPVNASDYKEINDVLAPRFYDLALLPMFSSNSVTTKLTNSIVSDAAACVFTSQYVVNYNISDTDVVAKVDYDVSIVQGQQTDTYSQSETFRDGGYTIAMDDGKPQSADVTIEDMITYVQGYLEENITSLAYWENATITQVGGLVYLEIDYSDEFANHISQYGSTLLFNDASFLDNLASAHTIAECAGYMAIHPATGFPTATGISYNGAHTIDGTDYSLTIQIDQSLDLASHSAYEAVTGEAPAMAEPENKATPLFYHVTGDKGQEMWLLGTIHVGDSRTSYLPQEIYDALAVSDALAVEFDPLAFEEQIAKNSKLANQVSACYFYSDGSQAKDHLDADIYSDAIKLMKASGNYNVNADYMKVFLWTQSIENFYLQLGYTLITDVGVDNQLLKIARDSGKKILDIESGLSQMQMLSNFSPELQEILLEDCLATQADAYCADTARLYELWCAGDEAALREELSDEVGLSKLTPEELEEYEQYKHLLEEYNQAMSYDRNSQMLSVAIDYLKSGKTVFYAVGLAHLLNNVNGLVGALREAGYTVELVTFH